MTTAGPGENDELARERVAALIDANPERVFYSRQIEVLLEDEFFHWVTNRAIKSLIGRKTILMEKHSLAHGGDLHTIRHRRFRFAKRKIDDLVELVSQYSSPIVGEALGERGEHLVHDGFSRLGCRLLARDCRELGGRKWERTEHNMDFIYELDGQRYAVEVKNTLPYIERNELTVKRALCAELGVVPVFACRMFAKTVTYDLYRSGGYSLIFKHQYYPGVLGDLVGRIARELELPVKTDRRIDDGVWNNFAKWHRARMERLQR